MVLERRIEMVDHAPTIVGDVPATAAASLSAGDDAVQLALRAGCTVVQLHNTDIGTHSEGTGPNDQLLRIDDLSWVERAKILVNVLDAITRRVTNWAELEPIERPSTIGFRAALSSKETATLRDAVRS